MHEYTLTPAFFSQMRKKLLTVGVPIIGLAALVGLLIGGRGNLTSPAVVIIVPVFALLIAFSLFNSLRQQQRLWASYRLVVDENAIKRIQHGLPDIMIEKSELAKIVETASGGLAVHATNPNRQIVIPATLDGYSTVRSQLADWHAIETLSPTSAKWLSIQPVAWGLFALVAFMTTMLATNTILVVVAGTLLLALLLLSLVLIQRSRYLTTQTKRASWFIIFPIFAIGARIVLALAYP